TTTTTTTATATTATNTIIDRLGKTIKASSAHVHHGILENCIKHAQMDWINSPYREFAKTITAQHLCDFKKNVSVFTFGSSVAFSRDRNEDPAENRKTITQEEKLEIPASNAEGSGNIVQGSQSAVATERYRAAREKLTAQEQKELVFLRLTDSELTNQQTCRLYMNNAVSFNVLLKDLKKNIPKPLIPLIENIQSIHAVTKKHGSEKKIEHEEVLIAWYRDYIKDNGREQAQFGNNTSLLPVIRDKMKELLDIAPDQIDITCPPQDERLCGLDNKTHSRIKKLLRWDKPLDGIASLHKITPEYVDKYIRIPFSEAEQKELVMGMLLDRKQSYFFMERYKEDHLPAFRFFDKFGEKSGPLPSLVKKTIKILRGQVSKQKRIDDSEQLKREWYANLNPKADKNISMQEIHDEIRRQINVFFESSTKESSAKESSANNSRKRSGDPINNYLPQPKIRAIAHDTETSEQNKPLYKAERIITL
ncbi:MAG: hypothetical protein OXD32_07595, partial [Endozoicomonadaceae bacterium]|nr:hypothetical protein [Endozoicomonadaceae bacterium]